MSIQLRLGIFCPDGRWVKIRYINKGKWEGDMSVIKEGKVKKEAEVSLSKN